MFTNQVSRKIIHNKKVPSPESKLPENVEVDMDLPTYLTLERMLENPEEEAAGYGLSKRRQDFQIAGFTEKFRHEELLSKVRCSGAGCRNIPKAETYAFCGNFHLFCGNCVQNLTFCWVQLEDYSICRQSFCRAEVPLLTSFLVDYTFACPNPKFRCGFTGRAEEIARHFKHCGKFSGSPFVCRFSGCPGDFDSFGKLLDHLKHHHHSIFVERAEPIASLRIPWTTPNQQDLTWIPVIFKTNNVYFLIALRLHYGHVYQWIYVHDERPREDKGEIYILTGFEIAKESVTMLKEDPPHSLTTSIYKIAENEKCFVTNVEVFFDEHIFFDREKNMIYFIFDLDIALL